MVDLVVLPLLVPGDLPVRVVLAAASSSSHLRIKLNSRLRQLFRGIAHALQLADLGRRVLIVAVVARVHDPILGHPLVQPSETIGQVMLYSRILFTLFLLVKCGPTC